MKTRLKQLLLELSYQKKNVTLASGRQSDFYFDGKQTSLHPEGATLIGQLFLEQINQSFPEVQAVGGPTLGADPLATAVSIASYQAGTPLPAFIVRKEPKKHGTEAWIEGAKNLPPQAKVVLLEDVVTTGGSVIKAVERVQESGLTVLGVMVLVDRNEGASQVFDEKGIVLKSLFTKESLLL